MSYDFDLFVIGGGSGGIATARRAAEYGAKVALAEMGRLGGTCVNRGCIPKKLMVYAASFPQTFRESQGYGWSPVHSSLDWQHLVNVVNQEVSRLNGIYQKMVDNSKVTIFPARAKFLDSNTVEVNGQKSTAERILIAVGSRPIKPNIPGIEHALVSDDLFTLAQQPKQIVILGGGYIGSEFACIFNGLGTKVTQIIRKDKILAGFDEDLRSEVQEAMLHSGIKILTNSQPKSIEKTDNGLKIFLEESEEIVLAEAIALAATGRVPNIEDLGLDLTGVDIKNGAIAVNEQSQTSQPNIYAVGDCTNRINLTPVAIGEGRALADTIYGNKPRLMSHIDVPSAIFTHPEAATVGLSEQQAKQKYGPEDIKSYRAKFRPLYHTLSGEAEKTMMKLIVQISTDRVLGAHMVGEHASEIIQGVAIVIKMGATKADFDATVGIHPSAAEEFVTMR